MNAGLPIPGAIDDFTPAWMTEALAVGGFDVEVASIQAAPVGTGQMARSERLRLSYARGEGPASLVAKFAASDPTSRAAGASGGYLAEVNFYRHVASMVQVNTPACHYADLSSDSAEFVLLLEDMAPATQGDQIAGCSLAEAEVAVANLVGLHAPRWNDAALHDLPWVNKRTAAGAEFLEALLVADTAGFVERYRERLTGTEQAILTRFAASSGSWSMARQEPFAPLHGDYRLDNLLFDHSRDPIAVSAVDWQTLGIDLPAKDVAYFIGNGLPAELRRLHERDLVARYHAGLVAAGVNGYGFADCWDDYVYAQFHGLVITVLGCMHVVRTDRGDEMFVTMARRHCAAIAELGSEALLQ